MADITKIQPMGDSTQYELLAKAFSTNQSITLTGDTTGTASSVAGWTINTTTNLHLTSYSFTTTQPLSKYITFDQSNPNGAPTNAWYNGFISAHSNYLASYIINAHRSADWYVGYGEYNTTTNIATAPTWYKLLHTGNYNTYSPTLTGTGATGTWGISISGNAATATKLANARNIAITGAVTGNANFDGSGNISISTSDALAVTTITKSITVTTSWQNTGIQSENLPSGTYIIQMSGFNSGYVGQWGEVYSGILTWYNGGTNSTDYDDIVLHKAGHASNGASIFLRTARSPNTDGKFRLQIRGSTNGGSATTVTFKFRRMI